MTAPNDTAAAPPSGCSYEREGDTAIVTLKPALSDVKWDQIETLGSAIETRLANDKPKKVLFDISPLTYMGSAMVALVVRWWKTVEKAGGKSVVVCNDDNVLEVLRLASLDKHWTIKGSREEAFTELGARSFSGGGAAAAPADDAAGGGDGPLLPLTIGGVALPVGIVGAVLYLINEQPKLGLGLALGGGLTAVAAGVLGAILCGGTRRAASIAIAVFGALITGLAVYRLDDLRGVPDPVEIEEPAEPVVADPAMPAAGNAVDPVDPATGDPVLPADPTHDADGGAEPTGRGGATTLPDGPAAAGGGMTSPDGAGGGTTSPDGAGGGATSPGGPGGGGAVREIGRGTAGG